jgi:hypothetical protein
VDVRRLTKIMTHKVYSVGPAEKNRRHLNSLTEGRRTAYRSAASDCEQSEQRESAATAC